MPGRDAETLSTLPTSFDDASHPRFRMPRANHAAVAIWPIAIAAAAPGRPQLSACGCANRRSAAMVPAPVHVHAAIGATPSPWPMYTPSAALEAAKKGKPSARVATYARTMGAVSGGTCIMRSSGSASAASPTARTAPTKKLVVVAAVAVRRVVAAAAAASAASVSSSAPKKGVSPAAVASASRAFAAFAAALATAVVTTTDIAKHISAANAKSDDEGASAAR
mmetsp:Transcript_5437/g.23002  ORF Transcript_5437/g.23002 Transcript_5437/m.23002 type:complete len:223 (-) Transcript_5437:730-1398(-)